MIEIICCPVCRSEELISIKEHAFTFPGNDVEKKLLDSKYVRLWILFTKILNNKKSIVFHSTICKTYGFIFTNPRFSKEEMVIKYKTINELGSVKKRLEQNPPFNLDQRAKRIYNLIDRCHKRSSGLPPKILDYGGASGYNLVPFFDAFDCYIVDYEKWELPDEIRYLGQDLSCLENSMDFDVILLLHTLEHEIESMQLINELCSHLKDDGLFYVEVPLGCFKEWRYMTEPLTHINFFSEQSLFKCFDLAGLNVIHLSTSYQWVTHGKFWCLNIVGTKSKSVDYSTSKYLTITQQINKIHYYLKYLFNKQIVFRDIRQIWRQ